MKIGSSGLTKPVLTLLLACGACNPDAAPPGGVVTTMDTVNGVAHVRNAGAPPAWTTTLMLRIGSVAGGPEEFGRIRSLIADDAGNVYVADNLADEVRVFDAEGRHVRTIGRRGAGPGEFEDLYSVAWLGDQLAAMDPRNARISVLTPEGDWIDAIRHFPISGPPTLIRLHPVGSDAFYAPIIDGADGGLRFVRITGDGPSDTITPPRAPEGAARTGVLCHRPDGGIQSITVPDGPSSVYGFPPPGGAIATSWTERYEVAFLTTGGDTTRVVSRERPPIAYPDSFWERALEPFREMHESYPGTTCEPSDLVRPRSRAALRHLAFDERGRLWVEAASEDGFAWEVFDAEGRLEGRAPAPPRSTAVPPYTRGDRLYQVEADTLGVQYVGVYRVGPGELP